MNLFCSDNYFTDKFVEQCKRNANILQCIPSEIKNVIKLISLEEGLYSQDIMIRRLIIKIKFMKYASVKKKYNKNESYIIYKIFYDRGKGYSSVDDKSGNKPSEATHVSKNN